MKDLSPECLDKDAELLGPAQGKDGDEHLASFLDAVMDLLEEVTLSAPEARDWNLLIWTNVIDLCHEKVNVVNVIPDLKQKEQLLSNVYPL